MRQKLRSIRLPSLKRNRLAPWPPPEQGAAEEPIRSELFSLDQLEQHAVALAGWHQTDERPGRTRLLERLRANEVVLVQAYDLVAAAVRRERQIAPAAEWLLDNFYVIEEQIRLARRHLPKRYSRQLPRLTSGPRAGFPRVYDLALELISHVDGRLDATALTAFISAYQTIATLKLGELWAIPIMLRLALIENLRRVSGRIAAARRERDMANYWADRLLEVNERDPKALILLVAEMVRADPPLSSAFVAEFSRRLQGRSTAFVFPFTWLEQRLADQGQTIERLVQQETQIQAADQVSIGNSIGSLRFLSSMEWRTFVEAMSAVEETLRQDPVGAYVHMDFGTRDQYRHVVEKLARRCTAPEEEVARQAVHLARSASVREEGDERPRHVGYYLIGRGRADLERTIGVRLTPGLLLRRIGRRYPAPLYVAAVVLVTVLASAGVLWLAARGGLPGWALAALSVPAFLATSRLGTAAVNWLAMVVLPPRRLPRMNFEDGIPADARTAVVVPCMLTSEATVDRLVENLEVYYLANRDPHLHVALLTDFPDAPQEAMPDDEALLSRAVEGIRLLNEKYSEDRTDIFHLFHRPRKWNVREGVWMGWERKRGKLTEFNALLRGGGREAFSETVGATDVLRQVRYVITLDADTQLPRDAARELVGTMAHPLNRPRFEPAAGRVTEGYAILQPRVETTLVSAAKSPFARLFSGDAGIDPYTRMVSDVYQDAFGEGSFIGKGIYDVDAFERACGRRFPENRILSHDLLEGSYARSGLVSDVTLLEDFPASYPADVSRRHRWIRGDWQIASWVLARVPSVSGGSERNCISLLSRWKLLDNLRRSLVPAAMLILLLAGWLLSFGPLYTLAVLSILLVLPVLQGLAQLVRRPFDLPFALHLDRTAVSFARESGKALLEVCCLPYEAYVSLDAVIRTAVRVRFTHRRLLEWRTSSETERSVQTTLAGYYRSMWFAPAAGAVVLLVSELTRTKVPSLPWAIGLLWVLSPGVCWLLSRPLRDRRPALSAGDSAVLRTAARRTWRFFETFVVAPDHYLPPDNFQEHPTHVVAHRTSPTNAGLALLSNLAAYDLGYASVAQLLDRTANTLATLGRLERFRGQFYNWYDTRTLEPLRPLYVSSVDSGNLAACLLTLRGGLLELQDQRIVPVRLFQGLDDTLQVLIEEARGGTPRVFGRTRVAAPPDSVARLVSLAGELKGMCDRQAGGGSRAAGMTLAAAHVFLQRFTLAVTQFAVAHESHADPELSWWARALERQARAASEELTALAPWVQLPPPTEYMWRRGSSQQVGRLGDLRQLLRQLDEIPTFREAAEIEARIEPLLEAIRTDVRQQGSAAPPEEGDWLARLETALSQGAERAETRMQTAARLVEQCEDLADLNYDFLYDPARHLLAIGYNVSDHRRDNSYYDLLASEARLTTFVAIAQGKLPQESWFALGRALTHTGGESALLSWSGSMFEYLMPLLVMPSYPETLLDQTCQAVVRRQIEYGRQRGVPWGISESGYSSTDIELNYQYRAFGVPGLGLKRGLAEDLVITPHASALALMVAPAESSANLRRLMAEGYMGAYGFYEAIDFTPARARRGQKGNVVRSWMAHHQGMTLLAIASQLLDRPMQERFRADPLFRATELLLQERVPRSAPIFPHALEVAQVRRSASETEGVAIRVLNTPHTPWPEVHLLSNGRYHVMVTAAGGGYSRWRDVAVTRWHEDATRDCWGTFCYVREPATGEYWSVAHQPTLKRTRPYQAIFSQARAEYRRRDHDLDVHTEIAVSPEDDIELRRVTITNRSRTQRTVELTTYAEVVLVPPAADAAHPVFGNLFVQTEIIRPRQAILCTRRPRSEGERPPWMIHLVTVQGQAEGEATYETDRARFIGRGRSLVTPAAMNRDALSNTEGAVLDPIVAIRRRIVLAPDEVAQVNIINGMAETREIAMALLEKYHDPRLSERVFEMAWTHSQVVLRQLDATASPGPGHTSEADAQLYSKLASSVIYANRTHRGEASLIARNRRGQAGLWGYGISGDLPIVLLRVGNLSQISLVREMVQAHAYWRLKGLMVDLVIWNEDQSGYRQEVQDQIVALIASGSEAQQLDRPGGIFVRRGDQIAEEDKVLLQSVARAVINGQEGGLAVQLEREPRADVRTTRFVPTRTRGREPVAAGMEAGRRDLAYFNGYGGFTRDGREYIVTTPGQRATPAPWSNVIANPHFGTVVTESGGGYTWFDNAHEYRLTPWHNDPVGDTSGEAFYVRDEESGRFWSPAPLPARGTTPYTTRHGFGYTVFEHTEEGIATELTTYVAMDAPVKFWHFKVRNTSGRTRRVSLSGYVEWVLAEHRSKGMMHVVTDSDAQTGGIVARNAYNTEFPEYAAFFNVSEPQRTITGSRAEFLGRNGSLASPGAMQQASLSGKLGARLDPCAAVQTTLELGDRQEREVTFVLGAGRSLNEARDLLRRFQGNGPALKALQAVWDYWNRALGTVYIETPDASLNYLVNGWLLYQVLSCRMWGRSGFYQSGGAFGFRDQLQDCLALMYSEPRLIREHILRCAAHQFRQGDVQHWWHPPAGRGVRTRFSDDYLWLPYAVARYVEDIGDTGILDELVHFIEGRPLNPDEESYYDLPGRSEEKGTVFEHCARAIQYGLKFGPHGLPLMGCGDWNDGMNLVGIHGVGESVWLAFFLYDVLERFSRIAEARGEADLARGWREQAEQLKTAVDREAWDGHWYRRAYFDNGEPLGSAANDECQIDALPQAWAVISGAGRAERCRTALAQVEQRLVRREWRLIQLFDPPFDKSHQNPGYIKGYLPGVRENGAQYTHAAVWTVMAFAMSGEPDRAWELLALINPVSHAGNLSDANVYAVEPYVVAADVYTNPQHLARGGWTWYTGSAGWMYRLIIETLLGIRLTVDRLSLRPLLPHSWNNIKVHYRYHETFYHIEVARQGRGNVVQSVTVDGAPRPDLQIELLNDHSEHQVVIVLGQP